MANWKAPNHTPSLSAWAGPKPGTATPAGYRHGKGVQRQAEGDEEEKDGLFHAITCFSV
jgi:hypothetical protein